MRRGRARLARESAAWVASVAQAERKAAAEVRKEAADAEAARRAQLEEEARWARAAAKAEEEEKRTTRREREEAEARAALAAEAEAAAERAASTLHDAASEGFADVCSALLARADFTEVNAKACDGCTALHYAEHEGNTAAAQAIRAARR